MALGLVHAGMVQLSGPRPGRWKFVVLLALSGLLATEPSKLQSRVAAQEASSVVAYGGVSQVIERWDSSLYMGVGSRVICLSAVAIAAEGDSCGASKPLPGVVESIAVSQDSLVVVSDDLSATKVPFDIHRDAVSSAWEFSRIGDYTGVRRAVLRGNSLYLLTMSALVRLSRAGPHEWLESAKATLDGRSTDLAIDGDRFIVAMGTGGMRVFASGDTGLIEEIGRLTSATVNRLAMSATSLIALGATDLSNPRSPIGKVMAFDMALPSAIREVGGMTLNFGPNHIRTIDSRLFVFDTYNHVLMLADATDPANLRELSRTVTENSPNDLAAQGPNVWLATDSGLYEYGSSGTQLAPTPSRYYEVGDTYGLAATGSTVLAVDRYVGLRALHVAGSTVVGGIIAAESKGGPGVISIDGGQGFMAHSVRDFSGTTAPPPGIRGLNVAQVEAPEVTGTYAMSVPPTEGIMQRGLAYVCDSNSLLRIIDFTSPEQPVEIGLVNADGQTVTSLALHGETAYVAVRGDGVRIIDISDPHAPKQVARWPVEPGLSVEDFEVASGIAYVAYRAVVSGVAERGMLVLNLSEPAAPQQLGRLVLPDARLIRVFGQYAYVATVRGVQVYDVRDPSQPQWAGELTRSTCPIRDIVSTPSQATLYLATATCGIRILPKWGEFLPSATPSASPSPTATEAPTQATPTIPVTPNHPTVEPSSTGLSTPAPTAAAPTHELYLPTTRR